MTTIHLPSATILALDPPEGALSFEIYDKESIKTFLIAYVKDKHFKPGLPVGIDLPSGSFKILGRRDDISEEVARGIVDPNGIYAVYKDYGFNENDFVSTALESLNSLLSSYGIEGNPLLLIDKY